MKRYDPKVSHVEFSAAPLPTKEEIALVAKAWGIAYSVKVGILEALAAIIEITPNARLRQALIHARHRIRQGDHLKDAFAEHAEMLGSPFMAVVRNGEDHGDVDERLLRFAEVNDIKPHQVADQIGRSEDVKRFTEAMVRYLGDIDADRGIIRQLRSDLPNYGPAFQAVLFSVIDYVSQGKTLAIAFQAHPVFFDQLYVEMVKAACKLGCFKRSFELLATT